MRRTLPVAFLLLLVHAELASAWTSIELDEGNVDADPSPFVVPSGLYVVTDVYSGNVVTSTGSTTTYSTATVKDTPGTFARVVDVVGTGVASAYDGRSFNGRARLPDGRLVAGTYYEDFVLTPAGYVSVNIVFFQDDSVSIAAPTPLPVTTPRPTPPSAVTPRPTVPPVATPRPLATPVATPRPAATPIASTPVSVPTRAPAPAIVASAAIALGPASPTVGAITVLRGRTVQLWPRAFKDGVPVPVRSWRLLSGTIDVTSRTSGGATDACAAAWLTPSGSAAPIELRFEVTSDAIPGRTMIASISVVVRSPALLQ
jgi:hypothetical protein